MKLLELLKGKDCFYVLEMTKDQLDKLNQEIADTDKNIAVKLIQGRNCQTKQAFFDETARILEFPDYFGNNWDAFNDSINDLLWPEDGYYWLIFSEADLLFSKSKDDDLAILLNILSQVCAEAPRVDDEVPIYKVLFQVVQLQDSRVLSIGEENGIRFGKL